MNWAFISAVNNEEVVKSSLLNSPGIQTATEVLLQRRFVSAAAAYNSAIHKAKSDLLVFVHQDVYLPEGWLMTAQGAVDVVSKTSTSARSPTSSSNASRRTPICFCST